MPTHFWQVGFVLANGDFSQPTKPIDKYVGWAKSIRSSITHETIHSLTHHVNEALDIWRLMNATNESNHSLAHSLSNE